MQTPRWHLHSLSVAYLLILTWLEYYIYIATAATRENRSAAIRKVESSARESVVLMNVRRDALTDIPSEISKDFESFSSFFKLLNCAIQQLWNLISPLKLICTTAKRSGAKSSHRCLCKIEFILFHTTAYNTEKKTESGEKKMKLIGF